MKRLEIVDQGVLYRNPHPGHRAICAFLANVVPLGDDEILCFYRLGQAFYSHDGRLARLRSSDGGRSWNEEGLVWDPRNDPAPRTYTAPHATRLADGTLVLVAHRYPSDDQDLLRFNPKTGGAKPTEAVLFRSADGGRSWSAPEVLNLGSGPMIDTPSSILELRDGRWFLACEVWKGWDDPRPLHIKGYGLFSADGGRTWGERVDFPSASDPARMYSHSRYTRMLDGRICVLQWTQSIGGQQNFDLHFVVSDRSGREWSVPQPTGIQAQTSWVADLGDGNLAAAYTAREGMRPGVMVAASGDGGRSWDLERQVIVWDAVGQEFLGVTHKPTYPSSHDNIAFGKPNLARLPGGDLIASWWCTQACVTHIRYARLAVTEPGVSS